jgi:hypothetical protein
MKRAALAAGIVVALGSGARADDEDYGRGQVIFARGTSLLRVDARGRGETEIATLGAKVAVRALRTDSEGKVLLVDLAGKWSWMPLDGTTKALTELPCADGPAQLAEDGSSILCRAMVGTGSIIVTLKDGKSRGVDVPSVGARLVGTPADRRVVWADKTGVWSAPASDLKQRKQVAPDAPLRSFLVSPDGKRAIGVYADKVYTSVKETKPAEVLMGVALDGQGARRKAIKAGIPVEWSHDGTWVLVQDGGNACVMMAMGGEYKCWRGYTGASISADGRWGLVFGNRDGSKKQTSSKKQAPKGKAKPKDPEPTNEPESAEGDEPIDDVEVAPPSGPLALYRTQLEGAFTTAPALIVKNLDGAAVWIPGPLLPQL